MPVPKRVAERIQSSLRQFQQILDAQKARDVSEADTVTLVKDILHAVFGYDKYAELTSEHSIRGTYCDLAVKIDAKLAFLIEVKAIGHDLKDSHIKQAIDYAANQGCEWVVLTNAIEWRLYHVLFKKPIDKHEIASFNLLAANPRSAADLDKLYLLTREGFTRSALAEYRDKKDATSRFMLAAIILHADAVQSLHPPRNPPRQRPPGRARRDREDPPRGGPQARDHRGRAGRAGLPPGPEVPRQEHSEAGGQGRDSGRASGHRCGRSPGGCELSISRH